MDNETKKLALILINIAREMKNQSQVLKFYENEDGMEKIEYQEAINLFRLIYSDFLNTFNTFRFDYEQWNVLIMTVKRLTSGAVDNLTSQLIEILEVRRDRQVYNNDISSEANVRVLEEAYNTDVTMGLLAKMTKLAKEDSYYNALLISTKYDSIFRYPFLYSILFHDGNLNHTIPKNMPLLSDDMIVHDKLSAKVIKKANFNALVNDAMDSIDYLLKHDSSENAYNIMYYQLLLESVLDLAEEDTIKSIYTYFDEELNGDNSLPNAKLINDLFIAARKVSYYIKPYGVISCEEKDGVRNE